VNPERSFIGINLSLATDYVRYYTPIKSDASKNNPVVKSGWTFNAVAATKDGSKIFQTILGKLR